MSGPACAITSSLNPTMRALIYRLNAHADQLAGMTRPNNRTSALLREAAGRIAALDTAMRAITEGPGADFECQECGIGGGELIDRAREVLGT